MSGVMGEIITRLGFTGDSKPAEDYDRSLNSAEKSGRSFAATMSGAVAAGVMAVGKAAISAGKQLVQLTVDFAATGDEVSKTAKKMDVGTRELQRLRYTAQLNGASVSELDTTLRKLQVQLGDALTNPTGRAREALDRLGLSAEDLSSVDAETQIGMISDAMRQMEDPAIRAKTAVDLFGRSGQAMNVLFDQGSEAIRAAGDEAERLGGVMGEDALSGAESLTDTFLRFDTIVQGLKNSLGAALAPAFAKIGDRVATLVAENDDFIQQDLPDLIVAIAEALIELLPWVVETIKEFKQFYLEIQHLIDYVRTEFPEAWAIAGKAIDTVAHPLENLRKVALVVMDTIEKIVGKSERLRGLAQQLGLIETNDDGSSGLAGFVSATGQRGGAVGVQALGDAAPGAPAKIAGVTMGRSAAELQKIASDPLQPPSAREKAQQFLPAVQAREASAMAQRQFAEQEGKARDARSRRQSNPDVMAAAQRAKLIEQAKAEGKNRKQIRKMLETAGLSTDGFERRSGKGGRRSRGAEDLSEDLTGPSGASREPLGGAKIVRIDASYGPNIVINIEKIETDATDLDGTITAVADAVGSDLEAQLRPAYDHYQKVIR